MPNDDLLAYRLLGTLLMHPEEALLAVQTVGPAYWLHPWPSAETRRIARTIQQYAERGELPGLPYVKDEHEEDAAVCAILADLPSHAEDARMTHQLATRVRSVALSLGATLAVQGILQQFQRNAADPVQIAANAIVSLSEYAAAGITETGVPAMSDILCRQYDAIKSGHRPEGLPLYHDILDSALGGGIPYGKMVVLGARPSHGKTSLADNLIDYTLRRHHPVVNFSFDDDHELAQQRLACIHSGVSFRHAVGGRLRPDGEARYKRALAWLADSPLTILSGRSLSPLQCRAKLHALLATTYVGQKPLVVVDFLQKQADNVEDMERLDIRNRVSRASAQWKDTIEECGVPGIVLAQLNRSGTGEPHLEHLKESGSIEEDAYAAILLWRPGKEDPAKPANKVYAYLRKNKGGPTCTALYSFCGYNFRYFPWSDTDIEMDAREMSAHESRILADQTDAPPDDEF